MKCSACEDSGIGEKYPHVKPCLKCAGTGVVPPYNMSIITHSAYHITVDDVLYKISTLCDRGVVDKICNGDEAEFYRAMRYKLLTVLHYMPSESEFELDNLLFWIERKTPAALSQRFR